MRIGIVVRCCGVCAPHGKGHQKTSVGRRERAMFSRYLRTSTLLVT